MIEITLLISFCSDYFVVLNMKEENNDLLIEEDEAENELQLALERSRRSKQKNKDINDDEDRIEKVRLNFHRSNELLTVCTVCCVEQNCFKWSD